MKKYLIPGYIKSEINNNLKLTNVYTFAEAEIEKEYIHEYENLLTNGADKINTELEQFLNNNEFLIDRETFVRTINEYYEDNNRYLKIIILPTEKCNFRCIYCYENHDIDRESKINYDNINKFISNKLKTDPNIERVVLMWFGGEPLLKFQEIIEESAKVKEICTNNNREYIGSITTNGYLLNKHIFSELYIVGIRTYQITLDGEKHDKFRVLENGSGTFNTIKNNISNISNMDGDFHIIIRVNVDKNSGENIEFYKDLESSIGGDDRFFINIENIFDSDRAKEGIEFCEDQNVVELNKIQVKKHNLQLYKDVIYDGIEVCYASTRNCYTFRPNGMVVKCTVALNDDWNIIGKNSEIKISIDEQENNNAVNKYIKEECILCEKIKKCEKIRCIKRKMNNQPCNMKQRGIIYGTN